MWFPIQRAPIDLCMSEPVPGAITLAPVVGICEATPIIWQILSSLESGGRSLTPCGREPPAYTAPRAYRFGNAGTLRPHIGHGYVATCYKLFVAGTKAARAPRQSTLRRLSRAAKCLYGGGGKIFNPGSDDALGIVSSRSLANRDVIMKILRYSVYDII